MVGESNEITVRIKCEIDELYKMLEEKGFKVVDKFSLNDDFFIPKDLDLDKMSTREIISKAVLLREVKGKISFRLYKAIVFKIKNYDDKGNILRQESINCEVEKLEDAERLLDAIGYKHIMNIREEDVVYEKEGFQLAVKDIENGDKLIEVEIEENEQLGSIEELKHRLHEVDIPFYTDNYFVKKAEIELKEKYSK